MRLTKERKIYATLVGVGLAGLGVVFFTSGPGAAVTEAAAAAVEVDPKLATKAAEPEVGGGDLLSLASKLKSFQTSHNLSAPADAFKPSQAWAPAKPKTEAVAAATQAADTFKSTHQLSAILVAAQKSRAIVNGRTFAIGQSLDGYKLVAVTPKSAVFQSSSAKVILRVPVSDQIAAVDTR